MSNSELSQTVLIQKLTVVKKILNLDFKNLRLTQQKLLTSRLVV